MNYSRLTNFIIKSQDLVYLNKKIKLNKKKIFMFLLDLTKFIYLFKHILIE